MAVFKFVEGVIHYKFTVCRRVANWSKVFVWQSLKFEVYDSSK